MYEYEATCRACGKFFDFVVKEELTKPIKCQNCDSYEIVLELVATDKGRTIKEWTGDDMQEPPT